MTFLLTYLYTCWLYCCLLVTNRLDWASSKIAMNICLKIFRNHLSMCNTFHRSKLTKVVEYYSRLLKECYRKADSIHPKVPKVLQEAILVVNHKRTVLDGMLMGLSKLSDHVLYEVVTPPASALAHGRTLSTAAPSMVTSRSSFTPSSHLHQLMGSLPGSFKSLSSYTSQTTIMKSLSSIKSKLSSMPTLSTTCQIKYGPATVSYGFEYFGSSCASFIMSPLAEKQLINCVQSFEQFKGSILTGCGGNRNSETAREMAKVTCKMIR